ncbi:MAG: hypothetical protein ACE5EQ_00860 [Phycisphaerae bacterium]
MPFVFAALSDGLSAIEWAVQAQVPMFPDRNKEKTTGGTPMLPPVDRLSERVIPL